MMETMDAFEEQCVRDLKLATQAINESDLTNEVKIICLSALYLWAWLADNEKEVLRHAFAHIIVQLSLGL